jgi:hypothetical protein
MFKYFLVLLVAGGVIYAAQHPDLLERLQLQDGPDLKVWVSQTHVSTDNGLFNVLNVQSRESQPIVIKSVLMNDDPKCVRMDQSLYRPGAPVKLGEVVRFFLGMANFNACEPVKVVITTDRGVATFNFE